MAERLFTNTTGAYGIDPVADDAFPHTFGEFTVAEEATVTAGRVVACTGANAEIETATSKTGFTGTIGVALDTVTGVAGRPQIAKVATAGVATVTAGGTVSGGQPVCATTGGKVIAVPGFNAGDCIFGIALTSGVVDEPILVKISPYVTLLGD